MKTFVKELTATYKTLDRQVLNRHIKSSKVSAQYIRDILPVDINHKEAFIIVFLDNSLNTVDFSIVGIGGISACPVDIRCLMQSALLANASRVLIAHNHPSGSDTPSKRDKELTTKIKKACDVLHIELIDHVIVTEEAHYSFKDNGILK